MRLSRLPDDSILLTMADGREYVLPRQVALKMIEQIIQLLTGTAPT